MIHKIHKIALVTDDVEGSVKFYAFNRLRLDKT